MQQKAVLKLDLHDEKDKKKAMKIVSGFAGIDSIALSMKDGKLTVTGDFYPIHLAEKLRKLFPTHIESFGPAKNEKKGNVQAKTNNGNKKGDDKKNNAGGKDQKGGGGGRVRDKGAPHVGFLCAQRKTKTQNYRNLALRLWCTYRSYVTKTSI